MREFALSIQSTPDGAVVKLTGTKTDLVLQLGILASSISTRTDIPLELLAEAVRHGDEIERCIATGGIGFDLGAIQKARGEK